MKDKTEHNFKTFTEKGSVFFFYVRYEHDNGARIMLAPALSIYFQGIRILLTVTSPQINIRSHSPHYTHTFRITKSVSSQSKAPYRSSGVRRVYDK